MDYKKKINEIKQSLYNDKLGRDIDKQMKELKDFSSKEQYEYYKCLMYPENSKGCKIPSRVPIATYPIQLKGSVTLSLVASCPLYTHYVNPYALASNKLIGEVIKGKDVPTGGSGIKPDEITITSVTTNLFRQAYGLGTGSTTSYYQGSTEVKAIPDYFSKYRLVSGGIKIKCISPVENITGRIGGGMLIKPTRTIGGTFDYVDTGVTKSGNFGSYSPLGKVMNMEDVINLDLLNKVEDSLFDGLEMRYVPIDNSYEQFYKVISDPSDLSLEYIDSRGGSGSPYYIVGAKIKPECMPGGFNWFFYVYKPDLTTALKYTLEYVFNYECIVKAEYVEVCQPTITPRWYDERLIREVFEEVRKRCVEKLINK